MREERSRGQIKASRYQIAMIVLAPFSIGQDGFDQTILFDDQVRSARVIVRMRDNRRERLVTAMEFP